MKNPGVSEDTFYGYPNWETWNAYNWITSYEDAAEYAAAMSPAELREAYLQTAPGPPSPFAGSLHSALRGVFRDMALAAADEIDWDVLSNALQPEEEGV